DSAELFVGDGTVKSGENRIRLPWSCYGKKMLKKIDPETGAHQFYDLIPHNMGPRTLEVGARYGQTGGTNVGEDMVEGGFRLKRPMGSWMYWPKYYQLLGTGYRDYTEDLWNEEEDRKKIEALFETPEMENIPETSDDITLVVARYYQQHARKFLSDQMLINWYASKLPFDWKTVNSSRKRLVELMKCTTADQANPLILDLIAIVDPDFKKGKGKMKKTVKSFLVGKSADPKKEQADIEAAVRFWETEIMSMEALLPLQEKKDENGEKVKKRSPLGNIGMRRATAEETKKLLNMFNAPKDLFYRVVMVDAPDFKARTEKYAKEKGIDESQFEYLIHGSPTPNMMSLTINGPKIYPDAERHGNAYDTGTYTADEIEKSVHYTSLNERSIYGHGKEPVGVINVYHCARGRAMYPTVGVYGVGYRDAVMKGGFNCLDAPPNLSHYRWREIVFYEEAALYQVGIIFCAYHDEDLRFLDAA
ncbi:MAG: hypothetical protein IKD62_07685, partial [Oscillospiraceae bacterium]|nr:hypothetical protein [Oscillospiraceae bacterium]